jgi:hypothetical protein
MPKAKTIVATTNPKTGEPIAAGAEVDLDDEAYNLLRQQGAIEASEQEQQAAQTPEAQGNYAERVSREDVATTTPEEPAKEKQ